MHIIIIRTKIHTTQYNIPELTKKNAIPSRFKACTSSTRIGRGRSAAFQSVSANTYTSKANMDAQTPISARGLFGMMQVRRRIGSGVISPGLECIWAGNESGGEYVFVWMCADMMRRQGEKAKDVDYSNNINGR